MNTEWVVWFYSDSGHPTEWIDSGEADGRDASEEAASEAIADHLDTQGSFTLEHETYEPPFAELVADLLADDEGLHKAKNSHGNIVPADDMVAVEYGVYLICCAEAITHEWVDSTPGVFEWTGRCSCGSHLDTDNSFAECAKTGKTIAKFYPYTGPGSI